MASASFCRVLLSQIGRTVSPAFATNMVSRCGGPPLGGAICPPPLPGLLSAIATMGFTYLHSHDTTPMSDLPKARCYTQATTSDNECNVRRWNGWGWWGGGGRTRCRSRARLWMKGRPKAAHSVGVATVRER